MMRVRILTGMPGYPAGTVVEVAETTARMWLGQGRVEPIKDAPPVRQPAVERATAEPQAETAVSTPSRSRRG